ncbi:hypothetical protein A8V33_01780 [Rickettsia sp. wb]|nr:hypothetical protein A8V33_01780 [Rickettsia sp. wb]
MASMSFPRSIARIGQFPLYHPLAALPAWIESRHCKERSDVAISGNNDEIASSKLTVFLAMTRK